MMEKNIAAQICFTLAKVCDVKGRCELFDHLSPFLLF